MEKESIQRVGEGLRFLRAVYERKQIHNFIILIPVSRSRLKLSQNLMDRRLISLILCLLLMLFNATYL